MLIRRVFSEMFALKSAELHRDALQYTTKSIRWTFKEVNVSAI